MLYVRRRTRWMVGTGAFTALLVLAAVFIILRLKPQPVIRPEITRQAGFVLFVPIAHSSVTVSRESVVYSTDSVKLLNYKAYEDGVELTVTQQAAPDDLGDTYEKLVEGLNTVRTFDSSQGKVSIGQPVQLGGGEVAVMNSKGTLLFVRPNRQFSDTQWRQFFNSLEVAK